ncbi:TetR/AcrR family transcriptional regulator [Luedemannella helvata]|uniref:TetR family transcriptional regulator n=1 Tax=Luedemannella helvata TaxID=349315 RepID=A0ABP4VY32_9ACTN
METVPTLRDRKKAATSEALHRAAMRLAKEHGLDQVTVEAIAEAANVSRRTFSNYFANKEDALLYGYRASIDRMLAEVRERPAAEPAWQALRASAPVMYEAMAEADPEGIARWRMMRTHPTLLAAHMALHARFEADLAAELANRTDDPLAARLMATAYLATIRISAQYWLEHPQAGTLIEVINQALDRMGADFTAR